MTDTKYDDAVETFTRELAWKWEGGSKFRALLATLLRTQVEEALKPVEEERDRLCLALEDAEAQRNRRADEALKFEEERDRLKRRLAFLNDIDPDPLSGWCGEHPRRFAVNSSDDGEECQVCRADKAEAENARLRGQLEDASLRWAQDGSRLEEFEQHERQTHETLGAILGTDTSLEAGAKRLQQQLAEARGLLVSAERWAWTLGLDVTAEKIRAFLAPSPAAPLNGNEKDQ